MAGAVDDDEPEPMPAIVVDWDRIESEEKEKNANPKWCFLCLHTQRTVDVGEDNPYLADLKKHAEDHWSHTELEELMRQLQNKYNETLRDSIEDPTQRLPWHKQTIYLHFTRHDKSSRIKFEAEAEAVDEAIFVMMQEELFVKNKKTGRKNVNSKKLPQFFKLLGQQAKFESILKNLRPNNVVA